MPPRRSAVGGNWFKRAVRNVRGFIRSNQNKIADWAKNKALPVIKDARIVSRLASKIDPITGASIAAKGWGRRRKTTTKRKGGSRIIRV